MVRDRSYSRIRSEFIEQRLITMPAPTAGSSQPLQMKRLSVPIHVGRNKAQAIGETIGCLGDVRPLHRHPMPQPDGGRQTNDASTNHKDPEARSRDASEASTCVAGASIPPTPQGTARSEQASRSCCLRWLARCGRHYDLSQPPCGKAKRVAGMQPTRVKICGRVERQESRYATPLSSTIRVHAQLPWAC